MYHLVTGGARGGKSSFALAYMSGRGDVVFIATAQALDHEMGERIAVHQAERGPHFRTVEAPIDLVAAIENLPKRAAQTAVVLDCLTMWVSNLIFAGYSDEAISAECEKLSIILRDESFDAMVVTNEVGWGIVPGDALSRRYRDQLGRCNQRLARDADRVTLMVAGIGMKVV